MMDKINQKISNFPLLHIKEFTNEETAKQGIKNGDIEAYVLVAKKDETFLEGTYKANEVVNQTLISQSESLLNEVKKEIGMEKLKVNKKDIEQINQPVVMNKVPLVEKAKSNEQIKSSYLIVVFFLFLIYATVLFYGNITAMEVASEKSSRVMEVLVSSSPTTYQMFGKIIGLVLLGLTQFVFFFLAGFSSFKGDNLGLENVPTSTYIYAIVFFVLGYLLYATILATIGSLASRVEELHQMISPINILIIAGFGFALIGLTDPYSNVITTGSFIPFFAPMLMFVRIAILDVPTWQIWVSILLILVSIGLFGVIGAKIYRGGVLIYDKSSYKNIVKAFKIMKK